jgi:outer membrane protein TolC
MTRSPSRRAWSAAVRSSAWGLSLAAFLAPVPLHAQAEPASGADPGAAPDTLALSLEQAVARSLEHGEEMRAAQALVERSEGRVREEISRVLPQLTGTVTYNRKLESIFEGVAADTSGFGGLLEGTPFAAENTWTAEITGEQLLWSGGEVSSALRAAKAVNRSVRASRRETAGETAFETRRAYYDAAFAERAVEIAVGSLAQARSHLRQVKSGWREGARSEFDLLRAEVDAANQEPAVVAARRGADIALLALKRLANLPLDRPVRLTTPLALESDLIPVVVAESLSIEERPALAAADADVDARRNAVKIYGGQRWPDLYLSSTLQEQAFPRDVWPNADQFHRNWDVSLRLSLPLFTGFRIEGQLQTARAELSAAEANRDRLRELVAIEAAQARAELDRSLSTLRARRKTVTQARRAFELAGLRYTNGMSTQLEVSDARLQLQSAELNEASATRDYLIALADLERAIGRRVPVVIMTLEEATSSLDLEGTR